MFKLKSVGKMSETICRLCCKSDNVLLEVFVDVTEEISLAAKIFVCFGVKIQEDDAITKRICKSCYFFTNSAYEYRISAQQNDVKLKKTYEETLVEHVITTQSISQDDFLNTLNLANKNNVNEKPKALQYHPSVQRLKRKYPEINIPSSCHRINIEPIVLVDSTDIDQWNDELTNLGIWAVNRKKFQNQTGVTLTRVRSKSVDYVESSDTNERSSPTRKKKKKILWCEPRSKSLRFSLRKKSRQFTTSNTNVSTDNEKKTGKILTEDKQEESVDPKHDDSIVDVQPRVTRSATKFVANVKNTFGEVIKLSKEVTNSDNNMEVNVESDGSEKLPNLQEIISESLQNMGSNEHANTDTDGNEKHLDGPVHKAVENFQSEYSSTEMNHMKISSVQTLSEQEMSDEILPTKSLSDIPVDEHDSDSMSTNNDDDLLMATGQDVTYICQTCNKIFDSLNLLDSHKKYNHRTSLQCNKCSKKFAVVEDQMNHMLVAHSEVYENVAGLTETRNNASPITTVRQSANIGSEISQPATKGFELSQLENNDFKISPPEINGFQINQPENTSSVIFKSEKPISALRDSSSPILEMLPETSTIVKQIENPIQLTGSTNSSTNAQSKLRELLGNSEESQDSSQNISKKSNQKLVSKYIPPILKRVARKSTARPSWITKETQLEGNSKIEECVISSDDDVEITGVVRKIGVIQDLPRTINEPAIESSLDAVLDTALQAQMKQVPQINLNETSDIDNTTSGLTEKALQPQILTETDSESMKYTTEDAEPNNGNLREDLVLLIVESDPEDDSVLFVPNESVPPKVTSPKVGSSTSNKVDKSKNEEVSIQGNSFNSEMRQPIMMVSNPQDKSSASSSSVGNSTMNSKITNEDNYINYIFNKCRYSDKVAVNEQKWILKDLQQLLNRNYVPVEVEFSNVSDVSASYVLPSKLLTHQTQGYWNYESAIKLPKKKPVINDDKSKIKAAEKDVARNSMNSKVTSANSNNESTPSRNSGSLPSTYKDPIPTFNTTSLPSNMVSVPYSGQSVSHVNTQAVVTDNALNSFLANPNTNASQNHSPKVPTGKGEQINLIYIVEGTPGNELAVNKNTGTPPLNEHNVNKQNDMNQLSPAVLGNTPQQKHILLSGMPYPNYTKYRYGHMDPNQPIMFRPFMNPPTNVNIQNFVSVNQTNIASTSTDIREQYVNTPPVMMPVNLTNPTVSYSTSLLSGSPGTSNHRDLKLKDPVTKPSIRIKNLSELTGKAPINIVDRNLLHGFYSNTVNNYINYSPNNSANNAKGNNADEFMQIS